MKYQFTVAAATILALGLSALAFGEQELSMAEMDAVVDGGATYDAGTRVHQAFISDLLNQPRAYDPMATMIKATDHYGSLPRPQFFLNRGQSWPSGYPLWSLDSDGYPGSGSSADHSPE